MAAGVMGPSAPPPGGAGVEGVRPGGAERRPARDQRRGRARAASPAPGEEADEPEPLRPPHGRLDVLA